MTGENEWKPSRWTPPADLEEAFQEGRSTRKLPDGSTAVLSWAPEMEDRWWSEDGAISTKESLRRFDSQNDGPQLVPCSTRGGKGVMFVHGSKMEDYLSQANDTAPEGQPWAYCPPGSDISNINTMKNYSTKVSLVTLVTERTPSILVSHDGRIVLSECYSSDALGYAMGQVVESEEQSEFYIDYLFKRLDRHLSNGANDAWRQPRLTALVNAINDHDQSNYDFSTTLKLIDSKRARLTDRQCAKMQEIQGWLRSLPAWASMIIDSRLANGWGLSLLTGDVIGNVSTSNVLLDNMVPWDTEVVNRCYGLSQIINGEIITSDDQPTSFKELIEEYGPCWLMQVMPAFDPDPNDELSAIDLTPNGDKWTIRADHDSVLQACKLAGAMNAPIELWPRFYKIIESAGPLRLDEITILMMIATPLTRWQYLKSGCNEVNGEDDLLREACYLVAVEKSMYHKYTKGAEVQAKVLTSISPDRPMAGQMVDLSMALDDAIGPMSDYNYQSIVRLFTEKPDMDDTITGVSLIVRDLNSRNVDDR